MLCQNIARLQTLFCALTQMQYLCVIKNEMVRNYIKERHAYFHCFLERDPVIILLKSKTKVHAILIENCIAN